MLWTGCCPCSYTSAPRKVSENGVGKRGFRSLIHPKTCQVGRKEGRLHQSSSEDHPQGDLVQPRKVSKSGSATIGGCSTLYDLLTWQIVLFFTKGGQLAKNPSYAIHTYHHTQGGQLPEPYPCHTYLPPYRGPCTRPTTHKNSCRGLLGLGRSGLRSETELWMTIGRRGRLSQRCR
jgi:hypothetical protein